MMKKTIWHFEFPIVDIADSAEFATLVAVLDKLGFDGSITGEAIKSDTYQITVETVLAT